MSDYHRHSSGDVVQGEAARCIDPSAGAEDVVVLPTKTWGERIDDISARMDAAYANRTEVLKRGHKPGSAEYMAADDAIEAVYRDLRALNAEIGAGR